MLSAVVLAAAVTLSACASQVGGTPSADESGGSPDADPSVTSTNAGEPSAPAERGTEAAEPAAPGECVDGSDTSAVDCAQPHTVEITKEGTFGSGLPSESPDKATIFAEVFPECRQAAADYLGSAQYDATTLGAWMLWADKDDWQAGDRWYRCGVAQLSPGGEAQSRTGSARDVLAGERRFEFQLCSSVRPSQELPQQVPCDDPHRAEAIGAVPVGNAGEKFPSDEQFNAEAAPSCRQLLSEYLGSARDDVAASWRWPDQTNWSHGFTNITCYAETEAPVNGSLRGIGSSPLPR
ncbi:septum formation family protein [Prauserella cavernicola]|nr:septum formation family protein [Prauserella cavernicola]